MPKVGGSNPPRATQVTMYLKEDKLANTQAGWPVRSNTDGLKRLDHITGLVLDGDVYVIFDYLCKRFNQLVEPIIKEHSWGWSYRPVRGYTNIWSEHAGAVAIDLNAPAHPMGVRDTFTKAQIEGINKILDECGGVVVWGGIWQRADDMHFQIKNDPTNIKRVADLIRNNKISSGSVPEAPAKVGTREYASLTEYLNTNGLDSSFSARTTLANKYGISNYTGTADQNLTLLSALRANSVKDVYVTTTADLNIRVAPPSGGKLADTYGNPLPLNTKWYSTGKTAEDEWGNTWVEGRSPYLLQVNATPGWVNKKYIK